MLCILLRFILFIIEDAWRRHTAAPLRFRIRHVWKELYKNIYQQQEKQYEKHIRKAYQTWSEHCEK